MSITLNATYEAAHEHEEHTTIFLTHGSRWIKPIGYFDKIHIFEHTLIIIEDDSEETEEVINTAHIISVE